MEPQEEEPEEAEEEAEPDEAEGEGAEAELLATFARRYCPQRPLFKAKWMGIRDAFVLRVKPFVKTPGKLEDSPIRALHIHACSGSLEICTCT